MKTDKRFNLDHQWKLYLQRVGLTESNLSPIQHRMMKQAFIGACGQLLILVRDDLSELEEMDAIEILKNMLNQVGDFFMQQSNQEN